MEGGLDVDMMWILRGTKNVALKRMNSFVNNAWSRFSRRLYRDKLPLENASRGKANCHRELLEIENLRFQASNVSKTLCE